MNEQTVKELAIKSNDLKGFLKSLFKATEPYKTVTKENIGEYVRIQTSTCGIKNHKEFNMSCPREGKIVKVNRVSFTIDTGSDRFYKIPMDALISEDINFMHEISTNNFEDYYNQVTA